jgi:uncharacterized protein
MLVESRREQVMAIAARHHASRVRLFGSAARGDDRPDSDIDLLVDFDPGSSLFDLMRMARELEALFGRAVDVISAGGLKSRDRAMPAPYLGYVLPPDRARTARTARLPR